MMKFVQNSDCTSLDSISASEHVTSAEISVVLASFPVDAHSALRRLNEANRRMIENRVTRQSRPTFHGTSRPGNIACIADWLDKKNAQVR